MTDAQIISSEYDGTSLYMDSQGSIYINNPEEGRHMHRVTEEWEGEVTEDGYISEEWVEILTGAFKSREAVLLFAGFATNNAPFRCPSDQYIWDEHCELYDLF